MKKFILSVAAVVALTGAASAADLKVKAVKAPPPPVVSPWDIAFGAALMNDYVFRGVTQSNHKPSVAAYFEGRYNWSDTVQTYVGVSGESISFTNRAAAEIDVYGGIRPTFGAFAFDFGLWGYLYPGGQCTESFGGPVGMVCPLGSNVVLPSFNGMKKDVSFFEAYGKMVWTINDMWAFGVNEYYSPNFLNSGAWGNYSSVTLKFTAPSTALPNGVGFYASGEFGRQWLGTSDSFYGTNIVDPISGLGPFPFGIKYADYNTWNVGVGFTWKAFTLDARYSDTDMSKASCNAFTSDYTAQFTGSFSPINPGGYGSKWCGATGIVKLSVDTTVNALK